MSRTWPSSTAFPSRCAIPSASFLRAKVVSQGFRSTLDIADDHLTSRNYFISWVRVGWNDCRKKNTSLPVGRVSGEGLGRRCEPEVKLRGNVTIIDYVIRGFGVTQTWRVQLHHNPPAQVEPG